ncbi:hypothetical protein KY290_027547 [Solanum tuberosum]|uniref:Uncharacterized protein n=1 Tax=Solanum tuberosum TaxID=4113 RepID=A0ABQ7UIM9_SOLTU|nr:hypothetical protein KY290_027547 [Solanum tuberosum]
MEGAKEVSTPIVIAHSLLKSQCIEEALEPTRYRQLHTTVARLSTEAEYRVIAATAAKVQWVKSLLQELGYSVPSPTIYCDNISTIYTCQNPVLHSKMKHLEIDIHFVRDLVQKDVLRISHISSKDQVVDLLTKPLSKNQFQLNRSKIGLLNGSSILRGSVKDNPIQSNSKSKG